MNQQEYSDNHILMLKSGTPIVALDVRYMGYACEGARTTRWQDGHRQIALGLRLKYPHSSYYYLAKKFEEITGHSVSYSTMYHFITQFAIMEAGLDIPHNMAKDYKCRGTFDIDKAVTYLKSLPTEHLANQAKRLAYNSGFSYWVMKNALRKVRKENAEAMHSPIVRKS